MDTGAGTPGDPSISDARRDDNPARLEGWLVYACYANLTL